MKVDIFNFDLPRDLIAKKSADPKDSAELLIINGSSLYSKQIHNLPELFNEGDLFIVNDTKVITSRVEGKLDNKKIEITFLEEIKNKIWRALVKPAKKVKPGDKVNLYDKHILKVIEKKNDGEILFDVQLKKQKFINLLNLYGQLPLPPYLKNNNMEDPYDEYQTIFASKEGAVASPTAGLHFTKELLSAFIKKNILIEKITLHIGSGTFLPVKSDNINQHSMHEEVFEISKNTAKKINSVKKNGGKIIAVGTTVLRALESSIDKNGDVKANKGSTNLFITPKSKIITTDYLLTNFHLPKSTLFILVCSYAGIKVMKNAYEYAIKNKFKFYSLGDACLIKKDN